GGCLCPAAGRAFRPGLRRDLRRREPRRRYRDDRHRRRRQAPADGWTLLLTSNTSHVVAPLVLRGLPYDPVKDFVAIAGLYHYGMMLIISPGIPARSTAEFVAWAKSRPQ